MKAMIISIVIGLVANHANAQNSNTKKTGIAPFQGTKEFCEFYQRSKYLVTIKSNIVKIFFIEDKDTSSINGKIINGKLYTDDAAEKSDKTLAGKYYLLTKDMIRILNTENGDYNEYDLCN